MRRVEKSEDNGVDTCDDLWSLRETVATTSPPSEAGASQLAVA